MSTHRFGRLDRAALVSALLTFPLSAAVYAQGKLIPPGQGGSGIYEVTAPTGTMTGEGHAGGVGTPAPAVAFTDHPATVGARAVRQDGPSEISALVLRSADLINLALGRPLGTPLDAGAALVLQIGDNTPATAQLAVVGVPGFAQAIVIATGQRLSLAQTVRRSQGLLKLQFQSVGHLFGGAIQCVAHTTTSTTATVLRGGGHGHLEADLGGGRESVLLTSVALRAGSRNAGLLRQ
jgi:hypothetical protein